MSSVTLAELEYGLHRKGQPERLKNALFQVLLRVDVLPWDEAAARCYGRLCCALESQGINLTNLDMKIATHCVATDTTLVSRDKAFQTVSNVAPDLCASVFRDRDANRSDQLTCDVAGIGIVRVCEHNDTDLVVQLEERLRRVPRIAAAVARPRPISDPTDVISQS